MKRSIARRSRRGTTMELSALSRTATAVLGGWLFMSALLLPRSVERAANAGLMGSVIVAAALASLYTHPRMRFINVGAALWLFVSTLVLPPMSRAVVAHDAAISALVFGLTLVPSRAPRSGVPGRA